MRGPMGTAKLLVGTQTCHWSVFVPVAEVHVFLDTAWKSAVGLGVKSILRQSPNFIFVAEVLYQTYCCWDWTERYFLDKFLIFFFFFFFYFTILYSFCHTSTWIHHWCTRVPHPELPLPPPRQYHPSGSSQCTSPEHPVSCIEPGLGIHFTCDNIHVSIPFSQIIPPLPSPRVQKTVLYICVSFAVSHTGLLLPSF